MSLRREMDKITRRNFVKIGTMAGAVAVVSRTLGATTEDEKTVESVTGPISVKDFGPTLMHEHVMIMDAFMAQAFPDWLQMDKLLEIALPQLEKLHQYGIKTIFDATPINLGRNIKVIEEVARRSQFNILASTGMYFFETPWNQEIDADWLAKRYVSELREGIQGTKIKAALIKCATDQGGVTARNRIMLQAAAMASAETDAPILTHTFTRTKNGLDQLKVLLAHGAQAKRIVIGHSGDSNDLDYLTALLDQGVYLGMDRFGLISFNSTDMRIHTIVELVKRGYVKQLMLSHDASFYSDAWQPMHRERYAQPKPDGHTMLLVSEYVLPKLREKGVSQADIDLMMCGNVQRLFC